MDSIFKITNLDQLVFGVDDVAASNEFLTAYGLRAIETSREGGHFEATDGTGIVIRRRDDPGLPTVLPSGSMLRETVYGCADRATLDAIADEVAHDRPVTRDEGGAVSFADDSGFALRFQISICRPDTTPGETVNVPHLPPARGVNQLGQDLAMDLTPRTLSHVVYFVPNQTEATDFYVKRLRFRVVDVFADVGPFLQLPGSLEHHALFLIQTPPVMMGIEHFAFHMAGPTWLLTAGHKLDAKGYQSFWGPGRHYFGSNWFWYFNCPMGCHAEYDADMDLHDENWIARERPIGPETAQSFHFQARPKWVPMGPPKPKDEH